MKNKPNDDFERASAQLVCGIDEVGRGPWAGPVVATAVLFDSGTPLPFVDDSKALSAKRREACFAELQSCARFGIGMASVEEIDSINILQATFLAMRRAVEALPEVPAFALIDGNKIPPGLPCDARAIIKGDSHSVTIAAASIIAKVTRDRIMADLAVVFPGYSWETNAGYGTKAHQEGLKRYGVTCHHRRSFKPIHNMLR